MARKLKTRKEPRLGRDFGSVTFAPEYLQQLAIREMSGREIQGRAIDVKVAIDGPCIDDGTEGVSIEEEEEYDKAAIESIDSKRDAGEVLLKQKVEIEYAVDHSDD